MLSRYIKAALQRAKLEWLEDQSAWYAEIPELPGVWATGTDRESTLAELRSVLEGWLLLGIHDHDELPVLDGIDLAIRPAQAA